MTFDFNTAGTTAVYDGNGGSLHTQTASYLQCSG